MESAIGTLLDRLQGLLSKGFLLAGFIPAFVFLSSNLGFVYLIFPITRESIGYFFKLSIADQIFIWLAVILVSFILGVAFWSLNPWFRQFLEGSYLPRFARNYLEQQQAQELEECIDRLDQATRDVAFYRQTNSVMHILRVDLRDARALGNQNDVTPVSPELKEQFKKVKRRRKLWKSVQLDELEKFYNLLRDELRINRADPSESSSSMKNELDEIHEEFFKLFEYGLKKAESSFYKAETKRRIRFPREITKLGPTRMANLTEVHREYGLNYYGLDIEWFWLRLLKIIKTDTNFAPILEEAKTQLDFTVAATVLFSLVTIIWLLPSLLFAPIIYLILVGAGIPVILIFYNISVQNYRTFVEAVRSAVDLSRLELLKLLHVELPVDSKQEKELWNVLMTWGFDNAQPIIYKHPEEKTL